jgi:transposase-like protein
MRNFGIRQTQSAARVVMICPNCGQENSEVAEELRGMRFYACCGDDCDYTFDLAASSVRAGNGFIEACKRFYAAFYTTRGQGAR